MLNGVERGVYPETERVYPETEGASGERRGMVGSVMRLRDRNLKKKKHFNPFYFILVVAGIAFCVTAFAFGLMTLRDLRGGPGWADEAIPDVSQSASNFMAFMDAHGVKVMIWELVVLTIGTVGAIATDDYWAKKNKEDDESELSANATK